MEGCAFLFMKILNSSLFHLDRYCKEEDIEVCVVKLNLTPIKLIILAINRPPLGNFTILFKNLDSALNTWYNNKTEFVVCGEKKATIGRPITNL